MSEWLWIGLRVCVYIECGGYGGSSWQDRRPCHHLCPLSNKRSLPMAHACNTHTLHTLLPHRLLRLSNFVTVLIRRHSEYVCSEAVSLYGEWEKVKQRGWLAEQRKWMADQAGPSRVKGENVEVEKRREIEWKRHSSQDELKARKRSALPTGNKSGETETNGDGVMWIRARGNTWHISTVSRGQLSLRSVCGLSLQVFMCVCSPEMSLCKSSTLHCWDHSSTRHAGCVCLGACMCV